MRKTENAVISTLSALFLLSGVAALIYQVTWQRLLFAHLGIELSTVTIVVSSFMLGLGAGGLAGGAMVDRFPQHALVLFATAEAGVGVFGLFSPWLLNWAADRLLFFPMPLLALSLFALILIPTVLMGATLPILVTHVSRIWLHIGRSTGSLYAANTLGAAMGAVLTGYVLFQHWELNEAIRWAGIINLAVAVGTVSVIKWGQKNK
ncbi:MAG: fused MFS/spermidine synthase [Burkholderiales bacterium]|nr:fused MFS/spermidine synthase [Burkholderiales bacterium]